MSEPCQNILTINTGSSSLKVAIYESTRQAPAERRVLYGEIERIGAGSGRWRMRGGDGQTLLDQTATFADHGKALRGVLDWLAARPTAPRIDAVGHRVVHGGVHYRVPLLITTELIAALHQLAAIAPDHLPQCIQAMEVAQQAFPRLPQVACFDTAFHRNMPRVAQIYPLPRQYADDAVIRYGFHGLSYEYITGQLEHIAPREAAGRVIIAHLGSGASMAAVHNGRGIDTTMGFTPTGGLMMGTRTGDLDPGVLLYLLDQKHMTPTALSTLVNRRSGLLGVSGTSSDMRDLLARQATDPHAAEAVDLFCYQAQKFIGALAAVLGGLDALVFTGGIGEHAAPVRARICQNLSFFGVHVDNERNNADAAVISKDQSPATVRVIKTEEDLMIARHTRKLAAPPPPGR